MPEQLSYVVIGNGIAGATAAEILRDEDTAADITVIADDPFPVYYRPALKDYLAGRVREDKLWVRPSSFYQNQHIRFVSDHVVGIQVGQHTVQLASGRQLGYHRLLLANGARPSRLTCPGLDLEGVTTLRTVADYQAVLHRLSKARRIVVSGSGTLALETIETLRHRGYHVTHLLRRRTLWSEVLDATASDLVLQQERRDGVDVRIEEEIAEISGKNGQVSGVVTTGGKRIACDMVLIAIGVEPIIDFIKSSGIPCGRGVKVDATMHTNAPDVYAAGDVLETTDTLTGRTRVIGQWYPAIQQARAAAYSMLGLLDTDAPFNSTTFYNATFLYGLDFACIGLTQIPRNAQGYQQVVANPLPQTYRKVVLKDGVPMGMLALGDRSGALAFKRAIDHKVNLTPVISRLFAHDFKLHDWMDKQGVPPPSLGVSRQGERAIQQVAYAGGIATSVAALKPQPRMEAFLIPATAGAQPGAPSLEETLLSQTKVITIGRQVGTTLLIDHPSISRRHADIVYANGQYLLRDLSSSNGTFVNDRSLQRGEVYTLKANDRIRFGKVSYVFQVRQADQRPSSSTSVGMTKLHEMATGFFDPAVASQIPPPTGQAVLNADGSLLLPGATQPLPAAVVASFKETPALVVITRGTPKVFSLKRGKRITLGRDKENHIVLAEVAASRMHAEVLHAPDGFYIRDLHSSNGVIVNQAKIDNPYLLVHGDRIMIGNIIIFYMSIAEEFVETQGIALAVEKETSTCSSCGATNLPTARFCATCGSPLKHENVAK